MPLTLRSLRPRPLLAVVLAATLACASTKPAPVEAGRAQLPNIPGETATGGAANGDAPADDADAPAPDAPSDSNGGLQRRAESGVQGMIIGTVIGGNILGGAGAAVGAALGGLYGVITGDVPFDPGPGRTTPGRRGSDPEDALEEEIEEEIDRQEDLENEIETELRRQEKLLAAINKQEEISESVRREQLERAEAETPRDPLAAPLPPKVREIPNTLFDVELRDTEGKEELIKTLDADRDGRPEIEMVYDTGSGQLLSRTEDTDYDGLLDATSRYEDGQIVERVEDTNHDGESDRWVAYENGRGSKVEVDRNFDGTRDATYVYDDGTLAFEEHDTNYDGRIDRRVEYSGRRRLVEIADRNHDGQMDFRTYFDAKEVPVRTEEDLNADGRPDVWEFYEGEDASSIVLVRKEEDVNSDGKVDVTSYYKNGKLTRKEVIDPTALE